MDWFVVTAAGILAAMAGFWTGRWSAQAVPVEAEGEMEQAASEPAAKEWEEKKAGTYAPAREEKRSRGIYTENRVKRCRSREKRIPLGWAIGSPVAGEVNAFCEGRRKGAVITAKQGRMYAPASGKIIRLYPMGNRMLLRTDSGVELLLQVGGHVDELCGVYFRPRVVQNEIVCKGKLLLEYDREGLLAEGVDTGVSISVEAADNLDNITVTGKERVDAGEELLWVREYLTL